MGVHADLRELSRGMHPAMLSNGGLDPAIKALARRSAVPTSVKIDVGRRLAEPVEAAAYYVVAEALTNTTKHGRASKAHVNVSVVKGHLQVSVRDNGVGGAVLGGGSGLIGLKDRVEAVSGNVEGVEPDRPRDHADRDDSSRRNSTPTVLIGVVWRSAKAGSAPLRSHHRQSSGANLFIGCRWIAEVMEALSRGPTSKPPSPRPPDHNPDYELCG